VTIKLLQSLSLALISLNVVAASAMPVNNPGSVPDGDSYVMLLAGLLIMGWLIKQHDN
jgi:hypothetical protein